MPMAGPYEIVLVPEPSWGRSLADLAYRKGTGFRGNWNRITKRELARAGGKCEYCGAADGRLVVHEEWEFDDETLTQRLKGYKVSCLDCNLIVHAGRASISGYLDDAKEHFEKVTGLSINALIAAVLSATAEWKRRSRKKWRVDVSSEAFAQGFEEMVNQGQAKLWEP
ncbi:MAG TPA: hypothetical protein VKF15_06100 [Nitrososphaerales archaeon]|nr:hypothetical protein [Nitrososphaerales archaeon]